MAFLDRFFKSGQNNSVLVMNNGSFSHNGPWKQVYEDTLLDRWHVGDFSTAEYTISADLDTNNKEILKVLVTATVDNASIVIYARNNTAKDLIEVTATVNQSYVDILINPAEPEDSVSNAGVKVFYTAQYFHNQTPLTVR